MKTESGNCSVSVLRLIDMSTNLKYRERERQRKRESLASEGHREKELERERKKQMRRHFLLRNNVKFCSGIEEMRNG